MAMTIVDAQNKINDALINMDGVADVLLGWADKDGGANDGPWSMYMMLRNLLKGTSSELIEVMEFLSKTQADSNGGNS